MIGLAAAVKAWRPDPTSTVSPPGTTTVAATLGGISTSRWSSPSSRRHALEIVPRTDSVDDARRRQLARLGRDQDALVAGRRRADAPDVLVEPLAHGAERVVVERVHHRRLEAVGVGPAVPALPDRRRAVADRVAPGGERLVAQQPVRDVAVAHLAQGRAQQPDADEAGGQVEVVARDVLDEPLRRPRAQLGGDQVHVQGEQVDGLGVALDVGVVADVLVVERGEDPRPQALVVVGAVGSPQRPRHLGHQLRVVGPVRRGEHVVRRLLADREPVAVVVAAPGGPQEVGVVALQVGQVALHRVPVALDQPQVAVAAPRDPRHDDPGVRPRRRAVALEREPRRHVGVRARPATARRARRRPTWSRTR